MQKQQTSVQTNQQPAKQVAPASQITKVSVKRIATSSLLAMPARCN
jgi:hypothetical protein